MNLKSLAVHGEPRLTRYQRLRVNVVAPARER